MKLSWFPCIMSAALIVFIWQGCSFFSKAQESDAPLPTTGEKLYMAKCGGCHELYAPGKYKTDEWVKLVNAMQVRSKITDYEKNLINEYLKNNAKDSFRLKQ